MKYGLFGSFCVFFLVSSSGCEMSDGDDAQPGPVFEAVLAHEKDGTARAPDSACLGASVAPDGTAVETRSLPAIAFGELDDDGKPVRVPGATVKIYDAAHTEGADCGAGCTLATELDPGNYEASLPTQRWFSYRVEAPGFVPTLENRVDVSAPDSGWYNAMRRELFAGFHLLLGASPDASKATLAGRVLDCQHRPISGAIVRAFDAAGNELVPAEGGLVIAYFDEQGLPSTKQQKTGSAGRFAIANAPAGQRIRLEAWGSLSTTEAPSLLACEENEAFADSLSTGRLGPLRADAPGSCGGGS